MALHRQTGRYLLAFLGANCRLDNVRRPDARAFKTALAAGDLAFVNKPKRPEAKTPGDPRGSKKRTRTLAGATVNLHIRNARKIFAMAVDDDVILFNPFDKVAGSAPPPKDWHYVSIAEFGKLFGAASPTWRLMLSLARLAGLRRDEALNLRWNNIDWERSRLTVISTDDWTVKDKDSRTVPMAPELRQLLLEAFSEAAPGSELVVASGSVNKRNISRDFTVLCRRAGVVRYAKPLHTLRKSCITDWSHRFAIHAVMEWAGHSCIETTKQFYLKVSDLDYEAAAAQSFGVCTQLCAGLGDSDGAEEKPESITSGSSGTSDTAGEGIRTLDVQLGKLAFYH